MLVASCPSPIHPGSPLLPVLLPVLAQVAQLVKFLSIPLPRVPISCVNQALKPSSPQAYKSASADPRTATSILQTLTGDKCYPSVDVTGLVYSSTSMSSQQQFPAILVKRARSAHRSSTPQIVPEAAATRFQAIYG
ncbi:hypothetical protein C8J57DRAFT_1576948 [Mycena rebaudengoi]|nr:hypothetical protein C8J57DRAFT_1576948 [Mycena rebaudengoi]